MPVPLAAAPAAVPAWPVSGGSGPGLWSQWRAMLLLTACWWRVPVWNTALWPGRAIAAKCRVLLSPRQVAVGISPLSTHRFGYSAVCDLPIDENALPRHPLCAPATNGGKIKGWCPREAATLKRPQQRWLQRCRRQRRHRPRRTAPMAPTAAAAGRAHLSPRPARCLPH